MLWTIPKIGIVLALIPIVLVTGLWASFAIYFSNLPFGWLQTLAAWGFGLGWIGAFLFVPNRRRTVILYGITFALVVIWWILIPASNDRVWMADVARVPKATVTGNLVTIENIRNWEQGKRKPDGTARAFLTAIARDPEGVLRSLVA